MSVWRRLRDVSTYNVGRSPALPTELNEDVFIYYWEQFAN